MSTPARRGERVRAWWGLVRRRRRTGERWWCAGFLMSRYGGWLWHTLVKSRTCRGPMMSRRCSMFCEFFNEPEMLTKASGIPEETAIDRDGMVLQRPAGCQTIRVSSRCTRTHQIERSGRQTELRAGRWGRGYAVFPQKISGRRLNPVGGQVRRRGNSYRSSVLYVGSNTTNQRGSVSHDTAK